MSEQLQQLIERYRDAKRAITEHAASALSYPCESAAFDALESFRDELIAAAIGVANAVLEGEGVDEQGN